MNLARVLSNLPEIKALFIDVNSLKFLCAENVPKWLPDPVCSLKHLGFRKFQFGDLDQLDGALCLLRNSPTITQLLVIHLEEEPQADVGPASNLLEAPNCLGCTLTQLQRVLITCFEGSRPELLFIKLLLAHSPSLENCYIIPSGSSDVQKRLDIARVLMLFPRSSPKAKIIYLNVHYP
ncbi:unnamed protein product [Lactuca virosa]|uniref:FBD domain-containing protein n=1 Tax=Lactuca virosa TaxID=75947 RepID=A0AAU9MG26_9ASTR|nr:unnamed protein product [Lactuca virosa]